MPSASLTHIPLPPIIEYSYAGMQVIANMRSLVLILECMTTLHRNALENKGKVSSRCLYVYMLIS